MTAVWLSPRMNSICLYPLMFVGLHVSTRIKSSVLTLTALYRPSFLGEIEKDKFRGKVDLYKETI